MLPCEPNNTRSCRRKFALVRNPYARVATRINAMGRYRRRFESCRRYLGGVATSPSTARSAGVKKLLPCGPASGLPAYLLMKYVCPMLLP